MPTSKEMKLRAAIIESYVHDMLGTELSFPAYMKTIEYKYRVDVMVLALARGFITPEQIPPNKSREVQEKYLKRAPDRIRDAAAKIGTDVHELMERLSLGEALDVPNEYKNHIRAWRAFMQAYQVEVIKTEFTVESRRFNYMGTGDLLYISHAFPELGRILADYKSSESGIWPDIALQLAAIRYADYILDCLKRPHADDYEHQPADVRIDKTTLGTIQSYQGIQITGSGYQVVPVRVNENTFKVFQAAQIVADWKTDREKNALGKAEFIELEAA
jgi:hypothetical protein